MQVVDSFGGENTPGVYFIKEEKELILDSLCYDIARRITTDTSLDFARTLYRTVVLRSGNRNGLKINPFSEDVGLFLVYCLVRYLECSGNCQKDETSQLADKIGALIMPDSLTDEFPEL